MRNGWVLALVLAVAACGSDDDACDRAVARLHRIGALHHRPHPSWMDAEALKQCREHGWDPVVNCAIAGPTDEAAEACIERGLAQTLHGGTGAPAAGGKGLNPLHDE